MSLTRILQKIDLHSLFLVGCFSIFLLWPMKSCSNNPFFDAEEERSDNAWRIEMVVSYLKVGEE